MTEVLIYREEKSAMQSGMYKSSKWFMKFINYDEEESEYIFNLMNWEGGKDVLKTIRMEFETRDSAIHFAETNKFKYIISEPNSRNIKPKSYASNFI